MEGRDHVVWRDPERRSWWARSAPRHLPDGLEGGRAYDSVVLESEPDDTADLVLRLNASRDVLFDEVVTLTLDEARTEVRIALQWTTDYDCMIAGFVNGVRVDEGHHIEGFKEAITALINVFAQARADDDSDFLGEDVREGLTAVVSVKKSPDPFVVGGKLDDMDIRSFVERAVTDGSGKWLEDHPREARDILLKASEARHRRIMAQEAWVRKRRSGR